VAVSEGCYWLDDLCASLDERGYEVTAIVDSFPGSVVPRLAARGVRTRPTQMVFGRGRDRIRIASYLVRAPLAILRLARLLRRERIEIVHSHIFSSIVMARIASWIAGVPHVAMVPGPRHLEARLTRAVDRLTCGLDVATIAGCEWTRGLYRKEGIKPRRVEVVFYGADAERFDPARYGGHRVRRDLGLDDDVLLVGLVAHFYPPQHGYQAPLATRGIGLKGHEHFLSSARQVLKEVPSARFLVVGGALSPEGEAYRQRLAASCADEPRIVFTGHREDVPAVLAALDVAVQCSLTESLGGTIEALLLERPVVCTRVGGMPEAVVDGQTGLVVPPADPEALAAAITRLLLNRDEAAALGRRGRAFMLERFTLARTIGDLDDLFKGLRRSVPGSPPRDPPR
jgi:glycosyltransferase involved in cell wall biosynthesis